MGACRLPAGILTEYLQVSGFESFQHAHIFKKSDGTPPWIKLYVKLLDNEDFESLSYGAQLAYFKLLLLASRKKNVIPSDEKWLSRRIGFTELETTQAVEELAKTGFLSRTRRPKKLQLSSNRVAPTVAPRGEESREEEKREEDIKAVGPAETNEFILERLAEYIGDHGDEGTPLVLRRAAKGLSEASVAQVLFSARGKTPANRAAYVVGALNKERDEAA